MGRRCFFLIGTLYMYRCVTMYITTLPVPGKHMVCAPKVGELLTPPAPPLTPPAPRLAAAVGNRFVSVRSQLYSDSTGKIWRILQLISGGGNARRLFLIHHLLPVSLHLHRPAGSFLTFSFSFHIKSPGTFPVFVNF